jgi:hypothetical protein
MRQMFMRQIVADAISKFQKITRQMLCDKCSKNDVTLIPPAYVLWREHYANPQNADVIWREKSRWMGAIILLLSEYTFCWAAYSMSKPA